MNKTQNMKKILSSCIVLSMVLTAFAGLLVVQTPTVSAEGPTSSEPLIRIYGEKEAVYPTQSYYGENDFVYPEEYDSFDPGIIEKDSITFNPAFINGDGGEYEIKAQGDASEKIFLRAFYEPEYTHPVDALMDDYSDVTLQPVETFDAIVTETTYHLVTLYDRDPTVGYPGATKIVLPYESNDPTNPGMEEAGLLEMVESDSKGTDQLTDGSIQVEKTYTFNNIDYSQDIIIPFMDHKVTIQNYENGVGNTLDSIDFKIDYIGNTDEAHSSPDGHTIWEDFWGPGFHYFYDRENHQQTYTDPAHRWYLCIENADEDYLRINVGRVLNAGETFYVDGVRYDMPAIYVDDDGGFKYITFQSPIPKGDLVKDDFSHVTSQWLEPVDECETIWVLPPFNENHCMLDDIGLDKYGTGCLEVPLNGKLLGDKDALNFSYVDETVEERFDSSLTERLYTNENGVENWQWYNVYTKPNQYTEFLLPDQETSMESDGNEYLITSSYIAPNSEVDTDRSNDCKAYDEHEIFDRVKEIALDNERAQYYEMPRFVYEYDAYNPIDFYINENNFGNEPKLKIYGEPHFNYPTQSFTDAEDFVYDEEFEPFDPAIILKDSITFNPAFINGDGGEYEIKAQGDASEKIFYRAFYEPQYGHDIDAKMDDYSEVTLQPVETFDAIVTETTYHLVTLYDRDPTVGYPGETKIVLPYKSNDPTNPGMEEADLIDVVMTDNMGTGQLTDGKISVQKTFEFTDSYIGEKLQFLDHEIQIQNFETSDYHTYDKLDLAVSYIGNMEDAMSSTDTYTIWEDTWGTGWCHYFDRENNKQSNTDPAHRWYLNIESASENYLRINLGRVLSAGETFYVDGVRYDMPAIYVNDDGGFKYITLQSPIPKGDPVWDWPLSQNVDDFSHVTSQYLASLPEGEDMWVLPPFNDDHWMIDDIDLEKYSPDGSNCYQVPLAGMWLEDKKEALAFQYVDETTEDRFETSLTERLFTNENGVEDWQWYNVYTKPNQYTEFVLPNQEKPNEPYMDGDHPSWYPSYIKADGNEYLVTSSLIAPNSKLDSERDDVCKAYDEHEIYSVVENGNQPTEKAQLAMIIDGSGSINSAEWNLMLEGIASSIENPDVFPHDGSVELTVVQFASSATVNITPTIITNANYQSIANDIRNIGNTGLGGLTNMNAGITLAADTLKASSNYDTYSRKVINLVTDGAPTDGGSSGVSPEQAAVNARNYLISTLEMGTTNDGEFDAEGIGITNSNIAWLRDNIVWPEPGYQAPPFTGPGWVRYVTSFAEFQSAMNEKFDLLFQGYYYPRMVFEFDACDGTGLFLNDDPNLPPVAEANGPYDACIEGTITFDGSDSYDPDGTIEKYDWNYGDGTGWDYNAGPNPEYLYGTAGTYTVTLKVTDNEGATDTDTTTVEVDDCNGEEQDPTAVIEIVSNSPYEVDTNIQFSGSDSYDNDEGGDSIVQYDWNYGDGTGWDYDAGPTPNHVYGTEGTYTVTLRVTDDEGATDTATTTITIVDDDPTGAKITMENVDIIQGETTGSGYLKAENVNDDVGSCEVTVSWNPDVANVINVDESDFEVIYWYADESAGEVTIIASNNNIALTGNFNIGKIHFEQVGDDGDTCGLTIVEGSEMLTDDPQPSIISHSTYDGLLRLLNGGNDDPIGDMNGDGNVNSGDVRYLALYLANNPAYKPLHDDGDVNNDGNVNSGDVRYLALYLAGDPDYSPLYP